MKLTLDQVKHVAKLASLPLTVEEEEKYSQQISQILDYINKLNSVNTDNIEPTFNATNLSNISSEDLTNVCLTPKEVLANGNRIKDQMFVTKGVFEEE